MKKIILFILYLSIHSVVSCQIISGIILDAKTQSKISYASVYFNATSAGTTSDNAGNFKLDISKNSLSPLTISAIGYYSVTLVNYQTTRPLTVLLTPKIYDLHEVGIKAKSLKRKRKQNMNLFREEFLGTGTNAHYCSILNEKDISFNYDSDADTLKVFAQKPIIVDNNALGYRLTYYLDKFEYYRNARTTFFKGNLIFEDKIGADSIQKQHYNKIRKQTYLGSRMHFFRTLCGYTLKTRFIIQNGFGDEPKFKSLVSRINNEYYLNSPTNLRVDYDRDKSLIQFMKKPVYFDNTGYFDPSGINWKGSMGDQRIADWLPYEYVFE